MGLSGITNVPPLHGRVTAQEIRGYGWGPNPEGEFCEVIGQILLHGVTVVLHRLVREAGGRG